MDKEALEQHNISRVVSVLRGSIPLSDVSLALNLICSYSLHR